MNRTHLEYLASSEWADRLQTDLLPWLESTVQLGDDVLEIGPGPGLTTDLLRQRVAAVTAVELDADLAADLKSASPVPMSKSSGVMAPSCHCQTIDSRPPPASRCSTTCPLKRRKISCFASCTEYCDPAAVSWQRTPLTLSGSGKPTSTTRTYRSIPPHWSPDFEPLALPTSRSLRAESIESEETRSRVTAIKP